MAKIKSSGNGQKCYTIMVTGKVQDIGFRALIENAGRLFDLSGLVFNARDGSVRIVCCGEESIIGEFSQEVTTRGEQRGATIQDIKKQELPIEIELPYPFSKVFTEDDVDLGRKLDIGNDFLGELTRSSSEILKNTSVLPDICQ
jgi:acylphosphatase